MRKLFRFLVPEPPPPRAAPTGPPNAGRYYYASHPSYYPKGAYPPLTAGQIRFCQFSPARRGLDPNEVRGFLYRVADELADVRAELARTRTENTRIKTALRDWQSRFQRERRSGR